MRLVLLLSYDGTGFRGWTDVRDSALRPALRRVMGAAELPMVEAASRTDAGVHALGQVCSIQLEKEPVELNQLMYSLNQLLPDDVCVRNGAFAASTFDVRANVAKEYRYTLSTARVRDPLRRLYEWHYPSRHSGPAWNVEAARKAARTIVGTHSFSAFGNTPRGAERHAIIDPVCTIEQLELCRLGKTTFQFRLRGDRFLYKMCRNVSDVRTFLMVDQMLH